MKVVLKWRDFYIEMHMLNNDVSGLETDGSLKM